MIFKKKFMFIFSLFVSCLFDFLCLQDWKDLVQERESVRSPLQLTWFVLMNEVLGESSSTRPPVLIVSIPKDRSAGSPFVFCLATNIIAEPVFFYIFNLSIQQNTLAGMWRCTFVFPLWKGGGSSMTNNYWPISKLCVVPKVLERLVNNQLKNYLY